MLAAQHLLRLSRFDLLVERIEGASQVSQHVFPTARPFQQHANVVGLRGQAGAELDVLRQTALAQQRLLCVGLVVPEVGRGDLLF